MQLYVPQLLEYTRHKTNPKNFSENKTKCFKEIAIIYLYNYAHFYASSNSF